MRHLVLAAALAGLSFACPSARAVITYNDADGVTAAPVDDRGWQHVGSWGIGGGIAVAPDYFLTVQHFNGPANNQFVLNGTPYTADSIHNISNSDLRLVHVTTPFPSYAPLYRGAPGSEAGEVASVVGFGHHILGAAVTSGSTPNGWLWGGGRGTRSGGTATILTPMGALEERLIEWSFDGTNSTGILTEGDSGGGVFIDDNGTWKLAGLNYGVDLFYRNATDGDANRLLAAVHDSNGLFVDGLEGDDNSKIPAAGFPARSFAWEITAFQSEIDQITGIPEPASVALLAVGGALLGTRRCRRRA